MERVGVQRLGGVCARLVFVTVLQVRRTGTGRKQQEAGDHRDSYIYPKPEGICLKIFNLTCALIAVSVHLLDLFSCPWVIHRTVG